MAKQVRIKPTRAVSTPVGCSWTNLLENNPGEFPLNLLRGLKPLRKKRVVAMSVLIRINPIVLQSTVFSRMNSHIP